jgi:hypothetical protein
MSAASWAQQGSPTIATSSVTARHGRYCVNSFITIFTQVMLSHFRVFVGSTVPATGRCKNKPKSGDGMSRKGAKAQRRNRYRQAGIHPPGECEPMRISLRLCAFAQHPLLSSQDLG